MQSVSVAVMVGGGGAVALFFTPGDTKYKPRD
jgi:hypothetical protein